MKTVWTAGLDEQKTIEIRREFVGGAILRERLQKILRDKIETARTTARSANTYENANWAYLQADQIGYERALFEIISLISEKDVEK